MGNKGLVLPSGSSLHQLNDINEELDEIEIKKHFRVTNDNSIIFEFKHNKTDFENLTSAIEKVKNLLKLENTEEIQAIVFKINKNLTLIKDKDNVNKFTNFINTMHQNYNLYIDKFKEIFQMIKDNYRMNQNFILGYLRGGSNSVTESFDARTEEEKSRNLCFEAFQKFHRFSTEIIFINNFIKSISHELKDKIFKYEELNKFYNENIDKMNNLFDESQKDKNINFLSFLGELINFFKARNEVMDKLFDVLSKKSVLYLNTLKSLKTTNFEAYDSIAELNDYFQIMVKHRFIRHIEANYKQFCQERKL